MGKSLKFLQKGLDTMHGEAELVTEPRSSARGKELQAAGRQTLSRLSGHGCVSCGVYHLKGLKGLGGVIVLEEACN